MTNLNNKNILFIATNGFQKDELFSPYDRLSKQGATVHLASFDTDPISAGEGDDRSITPDMTFEQAKVSDYDALIIPGGLANPDKLRTSKEAVKLVKEFDDNNKIIAAICHGPWLLAEADILKGRDVTSYASIKTDLKNAGANWHDKDVVTSDGLITSRSPEDLEAFNRKIIDMIEEGKYTRQDMKRAA
ncbi:type 1 glutamine amidotransferase domain-containing protein [Litorimonas sp. RW-G-Af-16]|uniref:type 1 glutamine amidotransferase domain-containing protein n=1 Tax=Litorimonas sp. RW-G-Af-16 TaxID=3241168 RepID=UPI00390CCC50